MADVSGSSGTGGGGEQCPSGGSDQPTGGICVVCFDHNDDHTACYSTACPLHICHKDCLLPWLSQKRSCPSCRTAVTGLLMKTGESVALPPLELPAELAELANMNVEEMREEFNRRYAELRDRIMRRFQEIIYSDSDSSLSNIREDQPPVPVESSVNRPLVTADYDITPAEVQSAQQIVRSNPVSMEERRRIRWTFADALWNETHVRTDEEVIRDSTRGEERAREDEEREEGTNEDEYDSNRSRSDRNDDEPRSTETGNQGARRRRVVRMANGRRIIGYSSSYTDSDDIQLEEEEMEDRRRRRGDRVWGPFEQVIRASVLEERARGEEEGGREGERVNNDDQAGPSTSANQGARRKRKVTISDVVEVREINGNTKKRRIETMG